MAWIGYGLYGLMGLFYLFLAWLVMPVWGPPPLWAAWGVGLLLTRRARKVSPWLTLLAAPAAWALFQGYVAIGWEYFGWRA